MSIEPGGIGILTAAEYQGLFFDSADWSVCLETERMTRKETINSESWRGEVMLQIIEESVR